MPDTSPAAVPLKGRDSRLDVMRGIALVMIFINHVPGNPFENYTSRNFGFTDAAEVFVTLAGAAAGLAYGSGFRARPYWPAVARILNRVWTLYLVQILTSMLAIAVVMSGYVFLNEESLLTANNFRPLLQKPMEVLIGIPILTHQFGYVNILPMYIALMLMAPLFLLVALRHPRWLLAGSVALWAVAGHYHLNLPNWPNPGGWFFNPLSWQLIFVLGMLTGLRLKQGTRYVPVSRWLQGLSAAYLLLALVWTKSPAATDVLGHGLWWLQENYSVPQLMTTFDKTYLTLPRLLHILAMFYLVSTLPVLRRVCASRWLEPMALLGRQALPVFATGSVLCFAAQILMSWYQTGFWGTNLVLALGLAIQFALAYGRERFRVKR
ncbi:OpgC family protein [Phaeovulum sp. W22_SRMD_FR3]|uniref:OpgC family protein n=1 Tax=Phaeovulum sp. W22_SRMD_FR3 TaxID=3240274 RepID=UPI003F971DAA